MSLRGFWEGRDVELDDEPTTGCSPLVDVVYVVQESPGVGGAVETGGGGVVGVLEGFWGVGGGWGWQARRRTNQRL
jgi:hypothetical protein